MEGLNTDLTQLAYDPAADLNNYDPSMLPPNDVMPADPGFNYEELFPKLPIGKPLIQQSGSASADKMGRWTQKMKVTSSIISQLFRVPVEERRFMDKNESNFGGQGEQAKICSDIMQKTGATIEISSSKDHSLTVLITGKMDAVVKARRQITSNLQTQAHVNLNIPKEHHRFILGKNGSKLKDLENLTSTKISIPRPEENSDQIRIVGTKEGLDKAKHEIQVISDEQAKKAFERIQIPKAFHPFIFGPYGQNHIQLMEETGTRINIPPQVVMKDEITISGEKDGVQRAKDHMLALYMDKSKNCQSVSVQVRKEQHKFIIGSKGSGIQEILAATGVVVEVPPADSANDTITLRGNQVALGNALTMVYEKANSIIEIWIDAPTWLHRNIIGPKGANIRSIVQDLPKVHVDFTEDRIKVEGPPEEAQLAESKLKSIVYDLQTRLTYEDLAVDESYHKHIVGKAGANINRIRQEFDVQITIGMDDNPNLIRVEGAPNDVTHVKNEIMELATKLQNETTLAILIDQQFHRTMIGSKGDRIREIRERHTEVMISFPEAGIRSDKVTLRGPRQEVKKCEKALYDIYQELLENSHSVEVKIKKEIHKNIIGKGGQNIKKIREETNTKIDLPTEGSDSDIIKITGKKMDVEAARKRIVEFQTDMANVVSTEVAIPAKFHNNLIGAKGALVRSIMEECGNVQIKFPPASANSDKVTIKGDKEWVEKAKKQLLDHSKNMELNNYTEELQCKPEHHKFLIGRGGSTIRQLRERTGARIVFPTADDQEKDIIILIGKKQAVLDAKAELETSIKNLNNIVESYMNVDPVHHKHFVFRRGAVIRDLSDEYGGVTISFPKLGTNSDRVVIKGSAECVEGVKQRINDIIEELESQVTVDFEVEQRHHRSLMGARGCRVQDVCREFCVQIKFPERQEESTDADDYNNHNGVDGGDNPDYNANDSFRRPAINRDIIRITGRAENCEGARQALLAYVPITIEIEVPFDYHRYIIGQKGAGVREIMSTHDVSVKVPDANEQSDVITVTGAPACVESAKQALLDRVDQLDKEKEDRALRGYKTTVDVDSKYHPKIIGKRGAIINDLRKKHDVQIQLPERQDDGSESIITVIGYEANAEAAKQDILKIVQDLEDLVTVDVDLDCRVHRRLIGAKGRNIRRLMNDFNVEIKFPGENDENQNLVRVTGKEKNVEDAKDELLNMEEEYMQDIDDREDMRQYMASSRQGFNQDGWAGNDDGTRRGFVVKNAPWNPPSNEPATKEAPDTNSATSFPSLGKSVASSGSSTWVNRK